MLSGTENMCIPALCVCVCVCVCERERERERERPETDWTQCQSPGDNLDDPMTKMRTSTEWNKNVHKGNKVRLHSTAK